LARKNPALEVSVPDLLAEAEKTLADLVRAVKVADAGDPKVTPDLEKHPAFLTAKTEVDRLVTEAAKLLAKSAAPK
ncbi:MAG TPA: hypothetical protein PKO06_21650, partial [Candidatus Ozemobacteraceae bacterium]|nr:hypothetical protein [Candidatus Ozemobacteraceae bacterium]